MNGVSKEAKVTQLLVGSPMYSSRVDLRVVKVYEV